jgi:xanthine permease XanP
VIFLVSPLEAAGDLTANSMISRQPVKGPVYIRRIKPGLLADGLNSAMAAVFNSMPMVTFAQNNGVIQLTGVASRYVAFFIAGLLVVLGPFPMIGAVLQLMPKPVLGGAELVMFGTVAVAGIKILAEAGLHRRNMLIVAISIGMGLGVAAVPEVLRELPKALHNIFESPITVGALCAIVLNIFLPEEFIELEEDDFDPEASILQVMENPEVAPKAEPAAKAAVAQ